MQGHLKVEIHCSPFEPLEAEIVYKSFTIKVKNNSFQTYLRYKEHTFRNKIQNNRIVFRHINDTRNTHIETRYKLIE